MARLAIKGHATRGKEVIEILEMLGGKNVHNLTGDETMAYYIIENKEIKGGFAIFGDEPYIFLTLEEFLEKFPYKVGDKVNYVKYNDEHPSVYIIQGIRWTGVTIEYLLDSSGFSALTKDLQPYKEETMEEKNNDNWAKWDLPDGYEFQDKDGNIINTSVIRLVKKQSQYPNTYEECCRVLDMLSDWHLTFELNNATSRDLCVKNGFDYICRLEAFRKLLICRDAYWKIAGKEMGLNKPWAPVWTKNTEKYVIYPYQYLYSIDVENYRNTLLAFPTREMSNAFYENFKDLIDACKELL